jgi:ABC-type lipoprotein export system ATPase subunit
MQIELRNVIPAPLKEKLLQRTSDVWNQQISFQSNQFTKIKAPSTGKPTFLHSVYKLRFDYEGDIFYEKENIKNINAENLAGIRQQKLSIVFQDLRLFPQLTAFENIELNRVLHTPFYEKNTIYEMADNLGVAHILQQKAGVCSYGEQQRIAIIRALIQPFEILLMDEPFSHLDENNISKAAAVIAQECKRRNAGLIITDLDEDAHFDYDKKLNL